jgi:aminoglycoside/choline kinase family phosphotransferase
VLLDWPDARILAMEDAGDCSLESMVPGTSEPRVEAMYRHVLDSVVRLHSIPPHTTRAISGHLQQAFGPKVYRWERELFARHFLGPRLGMDSRAQAAVLSDLARVGRHLASMPPVLVHRDLQSSNVFLRKGAPVLIDFQGMRFGPAAYDAESFEAGQACATRVAACLAHLSALELMDGARWWNRWARRLMAAALVAHAEALESAAERNGPLPRPEGWA